MTLAHSGDTRLGLQLLTITRVINMFNAIVYVLEDISEDDINSYQRSMATRQMNTTQDFQFVFSLLFMFEIFTITDDILQALLKKDQDIQNAMKLLNLCKCALQNMRDNGWNNLLSRVIEFCVTKHILVPNMEDLVVVKD